ncbi:MAG: hypothetical protein ACM3XM_11230 [Mycobacterium leprae]
MSSTMGGNTNKQALASQEAANQQTLQQMANKEGAAAAQLNASAATGAPNAAAMNNLAQQEAQNKQTLQQMANKEAQAANQLSNNTTGGTQATRR